MIADIFYPIFTLMITVLACCTWKKTKFVSGLCTHAFTRASPWTPWGGGLQLPPDTQLQLILALSKTNMTIFFLYYTLLSQTCLTFTVFSPEFIQFDQNFTFLAGFFLKKPIQTQENVFLNFFSSSYRRGTARS